MNLDPPVPVASPLDALPIPVAVLDADGTIVQASEAWCALARAHGLQRQLAGAGVNYLDVCRAVVVGDGLAEQAWRGLSAVIDGGSAMFELEYPRDSAQEARWFVLRASPCAVGARRGAVVIHLDVSAQRRAELALQRSEARCRQEATRLGLILDLSVDAICAIDREGRVVSASASAERIWEMRPEELVGTSLFDRVVPEQQEATRRAWAHLLAGERAASFETCCARAAGGVVEVMWTAQWSDAQDLVVAVARDVTDLHASTSGHHLALDAMRRSEERFRLIARVTSDAIWEWDAQTGDIWWSEGLRKLFGITDDPGNKAFDAWQRRVHADDVERVTAAFWRAVEGASPDFSAEYRFRRADGSYALVHARGSVVRDAQGRPLRALGGLTDLSERRRAEGEARRSAEVQAFIVRTQQEFAHPDLNFEQLLQLMCDRAREMTRAWGALIELRESPQQMVTRFATAEHQSMIGQAIGLANSFSGEALRTGGALLCRDCSRDPRADPDLASRAGAASMIATPLHQGHEVIGVLKVLSDSVDVFTDADVAYLQVLAESLSAILQRLKTEEELARLNRAQQLLSMSNLAQARLEDERELLDEICRLAVQVGGYRLACVVYGDGAPYSPIRLVAHAGSGAQELCQWLEQPHEGPDDPIVRALRERCAQVVGALSEIVNPGCREAAAAHGIRSAIMLPVMGDANAVLGALCLYRAEAGRLGDNEIQMLQDLVGDLAFGIRHIRSQHDKRKLEAAVLKVATGMSASNAAQFFEQLCRSMADALAAPASFVARIVRHSGAPRALVLAGVVDGQAVGNFEYGCAGTPCERLLDAEQVIIAEGLERQYPMYRLGFPEGRAYAGRSLRDAGGRAVGLLIVMWREPLVAIELTSNLLQIFAARATSELERRQTELKLREQASLLDQAKDAIVVRMLDGRIRYWNKGAERLYGWSAAEATGQVMGELLGEDAAVQQQALQQVMASGEWSGMADNRHKDGRNIPTEAHWTLVRDPEGRPQSILTINTDVSARLKVEGQLRQSQRLEAVGQLTGGVAHDFNNLLTVILGNADLLVEELDAHPHLQELADMVRNAAQRGADLTHQLLAFSRRQTLRPQPVDVDRLVGGMMGLLRRTLPESITVDRSLHASWLSLIDPAQLESALLNLTLNARDAMPRGGRIRIESRNVTIGPDGAAAPPDLKPGEYVCVQVADQGSGIAPEDLPRVVEPFFTTKAVGKGTGLGLSMVYGFVKQSQGHLAIDSELGKGTTISLYFPRAADADGPTRAAAAGRHGVGGTESILLVEDDRLVRRFAESQLQGLGYKVTTVENGMAALEILRTDVAVDLLFTDIVMPGGLTGPDLVEAGRRLRPGLRALYSSGYTENALEDVVPERAAHLLRKPYQRVELAAAVRLALAEPSHDDPA